MTRRPNQEHQEHEEQGIAHPFAHDPVDLMFDAERQRLDQAQAKFQELDLAMLDPKLDEARVLALMDELQVLGFPEEKVQQCTLSRYAMRLALGDADPHLDQWWRALQHVNVTIEQVSAAAAQAEALRVKYPHQRQLPQLRIEVFQAFLGAAEEGIIEGSPKKEKSRRVRNLTDVIHR
ncbi:MAG: hypothetical protein ACOYUK_05395 [Patescibacteria group bacterium]